MVYGYHFVSGPTVLNVDWYLKRSLSVMQQFRRFVSVLSRVRPQASLCGFVVDKVVLEQDLLEVLRSSPVTVIRPTLHTQSFVYH